MDLVQEAVKIGCYTMVGGVAVGLVVSIAARAAMWVWRKMSAIMQG